MIASLLFSAGEVSIFLLSLLNTGMLLVLLIRGMK